MNDSPNENYQEIGTPNQLLALWLSGLENSKTCILNLNCEAMSYANSSLTKYQNSCSKFADPIFCQEFIDETHRKYACQASFGGYLEDRSFLWKGTYLDETNNYLHLGIDFNVSAGTRVKAPFDCKILRIDNDHPDNWGWGPRVFVLPYPNGFDNPSLDFAYIFAHLKNVQVLEGGNLSSGTYLAEVGEPPFNGNWFPHLHLQTVKISLYNELLQSDIYLLDGYTSKQKISEALTLHPDPLKLFAENFSLSID